MYEDEMIEFTNGYGGQYSIDDDCCLYQSVDGDIPDDIPYFDDEW